MPEKTKTIKAAFDHLHGKTSGLRTRCEQYAKWTIPHIFPKDGQSEQDEQTNGYTSAGAEAVNSLANTIVTSLFRPQTPFFRQEVDDTVYAAIEESGDMDKTSFDSAMRRAERKAVSHLDSKDLRTVSTNIAKLLIITGNALMYYGVKKTDPITAMSLHKYVVKRTASGRVKTIYTCEPTDWEELTAEDQTSAKDAGFVLKDEHDENESIKLYTKIWLDDKAWKVQQAINEFDLPASGTYTMDNVPWRVLTWHRNDGETYGRGLVEDYSGDFNSSDLLAEAETAGLAILTDKKFGVEPGSGFDIVKLNAAPSGSYHYGRKDSIWTIELSNSTDFAVIADAIQSRVKRIQRAFLMKVAIQRDAERVTAEELRIMAQALESTHGGIYSKLAGEWQMPLAQLALFDIDFKPGDGIEPKIISGMDSLSRAGDMENFNWMVSDLAGLNNLPDDVRAEFDMSKTTRFIANNRSVNSEDILLTQTQKDDLRARQRGTVAEDAAVGQGIKSAGKIAEQQLKP